MIQCKDCDLCQVGPEGQKRFMCDPFSNIKEPECVQKLQLIRLDMLVASFQGMLKFYGKMAPMQEKMMKFMNREIDDIDESDQWKIGEDDADDSVTG